MFDYINRSILTYLILLAFGGYSFASPPDTTQSYKIGVLPSAFYTPETNLGFGCLFYSHFKFNKRDTLTKKSNTQTYANFTLNKQFSFENDYQLWIKNNRYLLTGSFDFIRFPEFYYGIGNDTKEYMRELISFDLVRFHSKNLVKVKNKVFAGLAVHYQNLFNPIFNGLDLINNPVTFGKHGYTSTGIGSILIIDNRDNPLNPSKGYYVESAYLDHQFLPGNENKFYCFKADIRKYNTIKNKLIWNGSLLIEHFNGNVPFRMLPSIGGARLLRGYYRGRFRDNNLFVAQHEFRIPIYKFIGIAAFCGIGSVAGKLKDLWKHEVHYNYGAGIRLRMNKIENTNIRIDYGFTKDSQGLYIVFAEAF
jgi:outer membrane protein assembly factor BamA